MPETLESLSARVDAQDKLIAELRDTLMPPAAHTPVETIVNGFRYIDGVNTNIWVGESGDGTNPGATNPTPNTTPTVPAEFGIGAVVKLKAAPALDETFTVDGVGDGIVHVGLTDTARAAINNPDHMGMFYPSALELVTAAPS